MKPGHSTGPRTEEGKRKSSLNALRHGIRAKSPQAMEAIEQEIGITFDQIHQEMRDHFQPADKLEDYLVKRVARCLWRIEHGQAMERKLLDRRPAVSRPGVSYEKIMRYERLVDIHLHRALVALKRKQSERFLLADPGGSADKFNTTNELVSERDPRGTSFVQNP